MEILVTLIEAYEHKHFPIGVVDPVETIKFIIEQQGLTQKQKKGSDPISLINISFICKRASYKD